MNEILNYLISKGYITQEEFDSRVEVEKQKIQSDPTSLTNKISLLSENTKTDFDQINAEKSIKDRIYSGEINASNFSELTEDEQSLAKLVLFKQYSPDNTSVARALSAVEFSLTSLVKLFAKTVDRDKLNASEQSFLEDLVLTFSLNDMPIDDSTDWRMQYLMNEFSKVQQNRVSYATEKINVTGEY